MPYAGAALSGFLIAACFLRFGLFPLAWVAFVPLLWALAQARSPRAAARIGFVAGITTNVPAFYWLVYTFHVFGGFSYALAVFFYACLSLFSTLQFVLFALAMQRRGPGRLALAAPVFWVALEFLYPNMFPWRMAHTQVEVPVLLQIGDLTGPYALSFAIVWVAAGCAQLIGDRRDWRPLISATALALTIAVYGAFRLPQIEQAMRTAPTVRAALVQGNIGIEKKFDVSYFEINVEQYRELSAAVQADVDFIVWPETVQQHWIEADTPRLSEKTNPFPELSTHLIFGGLGFRLLSSNPNDAEEYNSAFFIGPGGVVLGRYDKRILMPFGEFIPLASYFPWLHDLSPETGGFTPGRRVAVIDLGGRAKIGQLICYEDIVTGMPRSTTSAGAELLVTILNDAWYGDTAAPYQHQALALWRTVENRRYLLRASNSGVTSIIDAAGRVVSEGPLFQAKVIQGEIPRLHIETIYTRFGDVFAWLLVAAAAALLWLARRAPRMA